MRIKNEENFIESQARYYRHFGYKVFKQVKLNFGYVDLAVVSPKNNLILFEYKMSSGIHDVAQALGQLLLYREQIDKTKFNKITCIIDVLDIFPRPRLEFLKRVCAKYNVQLDAPQHCKGEK